MPSTVLAATALLLQRYRRYRLAALMACYAMLGLLPLMLYAPRLAATRTILLVLLGLYVARKGVQLARAHWAVKQLRLEEQFMRYAGTPDRLEQCLRYGEHLWTRSLVLHTLRQILERPFAGRLLSDEKERRVSHQFTRAFRRLRPPRFNLDLVLVALMVLNLLTAPLIPLDLGTLIFQAGLLAVLLIVVTEALLSLLLRSTLQLYEQFTDALTAWTLSEPFQETFKAPAPKTYAHTLLYEARPWFASRAHPAPEPASLYLHVEAGEE